VSLCSIGWSVVPHKGQQLQQEKSSSLKRQAAATAC